MTNPTYKIGSRYASGANAGMPLVTWNDKKTKLGFTELYIVNVGAQGKLESYSNTLITVPSETRYWQNGTVKSNDAAHVETNAGPDQVATLRYWTATHAPKFVAGTNPVGTEYVTKIKVYGEPNTDTGDSVMTGNGYESLPGEGFAGKQGRSSFPRNFKTKMTGTQFASSRDDYTTNKVPTMVFFMEAGKYRYDEKLSGAVGTATDLTTALNMAGAALAGMGYKPVASTVEQDDVIFAKTGYDWSLPPLNRSINYAVWVARGRNGYVELSTMRKQYTLVDGYIVEERVGTDDAWW